MSSVILFPRGARPSWVPSDDVVTPLPAVADTLEPDQQVVLHAVALLWGAADAGNVRLLLRAPWFEARRDLQVERVLRELLVKGLLTADGYDRNSMEVARAHANWAYDAMLEATGPHLHVAQLRQWLGLEYGRWRAPPQPFRVAFLRLAMFTGVGVAQVDALRRELGPDAGMREDTLESLALGQPGAVLLRRMDEAVGMAALLRQLRAANEYGPPLSEEALTLWKRLAQPTESRTLAQDAIAEVVQQFLARNRLDEASEVAEYLAPNSKRAMHGCILVQRNQWVDAQVEFTAVLGKVKLLASRYLLCQMALNTPDSLKAARNYCFLNGREMHPVWAHAFEVKLGLARVDPSAFSLQGTPGAPSMDDAWRTLARAWLGQSVLPLDTWSASDAHTLAELVRALRRREFVWLANVVETADEVWHGEIPSPDFYCQQDPLAWQSVLADFAGLANVRVAAAAVTAEPASRVLWQLTLDEQGAIRAIRPLLQKLGARGAWNKPRNLGIGGVGEIAGSTPQDEEVARLVVQSRPGYGGYYDMPELDMARAALALVGHPHLVRGEAFDRFLSLERGTFRIESTRDDDGHTVLSVVPPARVSSAGYGAAQDANTLARMAILPDEENPAQLNLYVLTQQEHALSRRLLRTVRFPQAAQAEMDHTLSVLRSQFDVRADHLPADEELPAQMQLCAELSRHGEGWSVRLMAAPLGDVGPRLVPGEGRTRVVVKVAGKTRGTRRNLSGELEQVRRVVQAVPVLTPQVRVGTQWNLADIEQALEMLEALPGLEEVGELYWPKGTTPRIIRADATKLALRVGSERDWLKLVGGVELDEGLVLTLEQLLATTGSSRYVRMGEGVYAALTDELRAKVRELAAVVSPRRNGELQAPAITAGFISDVLRDTGSEFEPEFANKVVRLQQCLQKEHFLPDGLLAELRPYQVEGFGWMLKLAECELGACLADDMGLGKTLQTIAVLLTRAHLGAALVVAPTTVCGNWHDELRRFAPGLNVALFGESTSDRELQVAQSGANDVMVVSYGLVQRSPLLFTVREWATTVLDEAQNIKNPAAQRTQTAYQLKAPVKIALTGTPLENRVADVWSIMNYCNPGLLGTAQQFHARFAKPIERGSGSKAEPDAKAEAEAAMAVLRRLVLPFLLRRVKEKVLTELPSLTEIVHKAVPDPVEKAHYEAVRRSLVAKAEVAAAEMAGPQAKFCVLQLIGELRQAACDPRLRTPGQPPGAKSREFIELARELIENGHRTLVFSQYVGHLELLKAQLDEAKLTYQYMVGSTPPKVRRQAVADFQDGKGDFFLSTLKVGGSGLNLTAADYVVIADPWWTPAAEDQAGARAHRMGQDKPVTVYHLITQGTVEEGVLEMHAEKRKLAAGLLEGAALVHTEDVSELIALMRA